MDPKIVKKTQDTLGKAIKKPPLTEKLLNKPPFRFLHDIITEVIKNTGVLKGLYSDGELNSANVTEKEAKMNFLQKAIDCVGIVLGEPLSVRPSKIVAGHEPEKTNEFLHQLGRICLKKTDTNDPVKKVLAGEKPSSKKKSSSSSSKKEEPNESKEKGGKEDAGTSGRSKDKKEEQNDKDTKKGGKSDEKDSQRKDKDRDKDKERKSRESSSGSSKNKEEKRDERKGSSKERDGSSKDRVSSKDREGSSKDRGGSKDRVSSSKDREGSSKDRDSRNKDSRSKEREKSSKERDGKTREGSSKERRGSSKDRGSKDDISKDQEKQDTEQGGKEREGSSKERHGSGKEKGEKERMVNKDDNEEEEDETEVMPDEGSKSLQRPASAKGQRRRPGSEDESQEKDETSVPVETTQNDNRKMSAMKRPSSARPAPPRIKKQEVTEEPQVRVNSGKAVAPVIVDKKDQDDDDDDTFIVEEDLTLQNMLEVKSSESNPDFINTAEHGSLVRKMLESKKEADTRQTSAKNEEKPFLSDATRKKEREMAEKEIERLRNSIQLLVRSAHPLGKIMDYVQEDIDSMQKELNVWREENKKHEQALMAEQSITDKEIAPLRSHLSDIEQEIGEISDNISVVKSNIIRNEEKIEELIFGVSRS